MSPFLANTMSLSYYVLSLLSTTTNRLSCTAAVSRAKGRRFRAAITLGILGGCPRVWSTRNRRKVEPLKLLGTRSVREMQAP